MDPLVADILTLLRGEHPRGGHTIAGVAAALGISRLRVSQALETMNDLGYVIGIDAAGRVSLVSSPDRMIDTEIWAGLKTKTFGRKLHCYRRIGSTNTRAAELAAAGAAEGTVVVAEEQTGGRGRMGRSWHSAPGLGIWASLVLRPQVPLARAAGLSLLAALAFAESAERELGLAVGLKWPNDGLIGGRKVLGVLTELSAESDRIYYAICGVGINVAHQPRDFPLAIQKTAGSLAMALGHPIDRPAFFRSFLTGFESLYRRFRRDGITPLLPEYRRRSLLLGKQVVVRQGGQTISGVADAIDENGALVIRDGRRQVIVFGGEATLRKT